MSNETMALHPDKRTPTEKERMMKWFECDHLPPHLKSVSQPFQMLAANLCHHVDPGPERTVAFRKLLEAKDAAVRAKLHAGG